MFLRYPPAHENRSCRQAGFFGVGAAANASCSVSAKGSPSGRGRPVAGGVHRQSVGRWQRRLEQAGAAGLKQAGRAGRKPKLSADDLLRLEKELVRGPQAWGYRTALWTTQRVAELYLAEDDRNSPVSGHLQLSTFSLHLNSRHTVVSSAAHPPAFQVTNTHALSKVIKGPGYGSLRA